MKNQFLVILMFGAFLSTSLSQNSFANETCEASIEEDGPLITVTVCGRKTSKLGGLAGMSCDAKSSSQCSFTNT